MKRRLITFSIVESIASSIIFCGVVPAFAQAPTVGAGPGYPAKPIRTALAPDLPAVAETLPGFESVTWFGVFGPKGLPAELVTKVNLGVNAALAGSDVKERFARLGAEPAGGTPAAFAAMVKTDAAKWKKIISERKLTVE